MKLLPLLLLFPIAGADPGVRRRPWPLLATAAGVTALGLGALWAFGPDAPASFFAYHAARGLHAESVAATVLAALRLPFAPLGPAVVSYGSFNVVDPTADLLARWLTPLLPMVLAGFGVWRFRRRPADTPEAKAIVLVASLCLVLLAAKVFSPQYLTWLLPFAGVLPRRALPWGALVLLLSQVYFRAYFDAVYGMTALGIGTLLVRDAALCALFFTTRAPPGSGARPPSDGGPDRRSSSRT
ncbi:MAG: hypothetical protein EOP08_05165 [Proteobacteria bacterium]|nr:MAG: hypothetical protein EOP08_05165 [Pseudomonadota bacterium]